ncbi:MBOAT family O-acyltransferase [Paenibacillus sp. SAFN-117]|uniref:MBOAT family O-acyltransferase n=1 Tax=Paenibacillus sp. SAFN-117 TaxID=3436860 RepID=UPI003F7EC88D
MLGYYKYADFIISNINKIFNFSIEPTNLALPIGISFYTFQSISYLIDVYRKEVPPQKNIINLALYISFFPQLVAGPIVRYESIASQLSFRVENIDLFSQGVRLFIIGFAKKILIANQLGIVADEIFGIDSSEISTSLSWVAIVAYTLQIYFDFSGYSDMAIGIGKMFGFHLPANFNYPYISKNISEFWRRWHITLGSWFRDYVYIPLGGNRQGIWKQIRNLFIVWLLTGIWHGASWTYIIWGLYYGFFIALERFVLNNLLNRLWLPIQHIYVLIVVMVGWVFFRADDFAYSFEFIKAMFGLNGTEIFDNVTLYYIYDYWLYFVVGVLCSLPLAKISLLVGRIKNNIFHFVWNTIGVLLYLIIFFISIIYLTTSTYNPFIYFRF